MKIGIISDTHGLLRPEVIEQLKGCRLILHAGDINRQEILDKLEQIAPVRVVRRNNDREWAEDILSAEYCVRRIPYSDVPQEKGFTG